MFKLAVIVLFRKYETEYVLMACGITAVSGLTLFIPKFTYQQPVVGPYKVTNGSTKSEKLLNVITHNFVWANQKTQSFVYCWLCSMQCLTQSAYPHFWSILLICWLLEFMFILQKLLILQKEISKHQNTRPKCRCVMLYCHRIDL